MQIELTKEDLQNLLNLVNITGFPGEKSEEVTTLKDKLKAALNGERDTS